MKRNIMILLFALAAGKGFAQEIPGPAVWDLQACLDYAKANNITINSTRLGQQSSEQDLILAKAARYPSLSASVSQSIAGTSNGINPASGYGINANMVVYNGGYLNNDIKQKQLSLQSAALDVVQQENDITLQITQAYYNIALAQENIVAVKDLVATSEAEVKQGNQLFQAGSLAKKDLLELQAVLANDKYNLVNAQNTEQQYELSLKQLLQIPAGTDFKIVPPDSTALAERIIPLSQVEQNALASRPEITNGNLGVQIAQLDLDKAKAGAKPLISVGGNINSSYANNDASYAKTLGNNFYQQLGVSLTIPIFDRKITQTNVAKAKINISQANLDLKNTKTVLVQQIEQAYLNVVNAKSQFVAAQEQLNYASEAYRIASEQLKIGSYNLVDYLQQRNLYVQALQSNIQAKYTTSLYNKIYNFYNGVPVTQ